MVLGSYVSSSGAGDACPDWPLCHGSVIPPLELPGVAAEYAHRVLAMLVGFLAVGLLAVAWTRYRGWPRLVALTTVAFGLLAAQVGLGGLTVASNLNPVVVALHLGVAAAYFGSMVVLVTMLFTRPTLSLTTSQKESVAASEAEMS